MDDKTSGAVNWLLSSAEAAVRVLARRDLLGQDTARAGDVLAGPKVRALLSGQHEDGGFGVHPYANGPARTGAWSPWSSGVSRPTNREPCERPAPYWTG
jgi:hypothetical protein